VKPAATREGLPLVARILGRTGMLVFWVVLAAAVFLERLRQELSGKLAPQLRPRSLARSGGLVGLTLCALLAGQARAEMLVSDTSMVSGTETSEFAFTLPGPGTVTLQLSDVGWPQPLSSLMFLVSAPNSLIAPWTSASAASSYFQLATGAYSADVRATAGGPLDLGVYSFSILFTPASSPVPLPAGGGLLLGGCLMLVALARVLRRQRASLKGVFETKSSCIAGSITVV